MVGHLLGLNIKVLLSGILMALNFSLSGQEVDKFNSTLFTKEWSEQRPSSIGENRSEVYNHTMRRWKCLVPHGSKKQHAPPHPHPHLGPAKTIYTELISLSSSRSLGKLNLICLQLAEAWSNWIQCWNKRYM